MSANSVGVIPLRAVGMALAIHTLWGGNPVAVKLGLEAFPPLWSGFLRFTLGCLCVFTWARWTRVPLWPDRDEWPALLTIGAVFTAQIALMNFGFGATTATSGAVLISTNPLFGIFFSHLLIPGDRVGRQRALGAVIAFVGVAIILMRGAEETSSVSPSGMSSSGVLPRAGGNIGNWIVLASACLLGLRLGLSGRLLQRGNEVRLTFWQMLLSLPIFATAGLLTEQIDWAQVGVVPIAGILYQGVVIAGLAFTVNFYLMRVYTPSVMISFNFVAPVAGVVLGMLMLGEQVTAGLLGGMALVAVGLVLIARRASV